MPVASARRLAAALLAAVALLTAACGSSASGPTETPRASDGQLDATDVTGRYLPQYGVRTLADLTRKTPGITATVNELTFGNVRRAYLVAAPAHQAATLPMIVVLHGVDASPVYEIERDELLPLVQRGQAVLVYPAGFLESWNVGHGCCGAALTEKLDDTAFVGAAVADAQRTLQVDPARTYLVGFSNGGKLAYDVACADPHRYAAVGAIAAVPLDTCPAANAPPLSLLATVGNKDAELPEKGHSEPPLKAMGDAIRTWRARNGCTSTPATRTVGTATIHTYAQCTGDTEVVEVAYDGLSHKFPTSGRVGTAASAATLLWPFLSRHALE